MFWVEIFLIAKFLRKNFQKILIFLAGFKRSNIAMVSRPIRTHKESLMDCSTRLVMFITILFVVFSQGIVLIPYKYWVARALRIFTSSFTTMSFIYTMVLLASIISPMDDEHYLARKVSKIKGLQNCYA